MGKRSPRDRSPRGSDAGLGGDGRIDPFALSRKELEEEIREVKDLAAFNMNNKKMPEPIVMKNKVPCKAIKILSENHLLLVGLDSGEVKVCDKRTLEEISS